MTADENCRRFLSRILAVLPLYSRRTTCYAERAEKEAETVVRSIRSEDAQAIREICEKELGHAAPEALIRQRIDELVPDSAYYLAVYEDESDGRVKGFLQAEQYHLLYGDHGWNIIALAVSSDAQRRGIGRSLLRALEQHAEENGASFIRLNSRIDRTGAHAFYEHMGYQCDKLQKRFIRVLRRSETDQPS